jgi:uncharacterized protein
MQFTWHEPKRRSNKKAHGLDFKSAEDIFNGVTFTFEDDRFEYDEQRFVTLGMLSNDVVSLIHTETENEIHCISFRFATKTEEGIYFESIKNSI